MSATPRDLLKPRAQRVAEVYQSIQHQAGQPNSQLVSFGCVVAVDAVTTKWAVSAGEYVLGQQVVAFAGVTAQVVPSGAATSTAQLVIVLIEGDAAGAVSTIVGAIASGGGAAVIPQPTPAKIVLGYLSLPASFTPATTVLTSGMCVTLPYSAGNTSPVSGF